MTPSTHETTDAEALVSALAEEANRRSGDCPELDQLADYLAGELAPEVEARVQDHLVACRTCTTRLLDLETLSEPGPESTEGVADLAMAAAWREQKARIADLESARQRQRTLRWTSAIAATFFVASVGLSVHVSQLRQTITGLEAPEANPQIVYLDATAPRSDASATTVELGPEDRSLILSFTPSTEESWADHEVQVFTATGSEIWVGRGLEVSAYFGSIDLRMPRALLPTGDYDVFLYGLDDGRREQLLVAQLRIE